MGALGAPEQAVAATARGEGRLAPRSIAPPDAHYEAHMLRKGAGQMQVVSVEFW
eukprot:COSAG06_NODE_36275_length_449_cov_0.882857_1_plen_53_part_10